MHTVLIPHLVVFAALFQGAVQQCCIPSQLQTYIDVFDGNECFQTINASYDAVRQRIAVHFPATLHDEEFDSIDDYQTQKSYVWSRGVCNVSDIGPFSEFCLTGGKLIRKSFIGLSPEIIKVSTYSIDDGIDYVTVGRNCVPVQVVYDFSFDPDFDQFVPVNFFNMTMGIKDESVFTPPKFCFKEDSQVKGKRAQLPFHRTAAIFGSTFWPFK